jgi:hypothetical protein
MKTIVAIFLLLALTGCSSAPSGSGVLGWWAARGERAAAKAQDTHDEARERQLEAARLEAEKTKAAADALPNEDNFKNVKRFAGNTVNLLAQAVPSLTAEQLDAAHKIVTDLRSEDAKIVAAAEARQAVAEGHNLALSRELGATAAKLSAAETKASNIAADNAKLAGEMLALKWAAGLSTAFSIVAGVLAVAYKMDALGMATGVARGIADLRKKNPATADLATAALDGGLNRAEQTAIAKRVQGLLAAT